MKSAIPTSSAILFLLGAAFAGCFDAPTGDDAQPTETTTTVSTSSTQEGWMPDVKAVSGRPFNAFVKEDMTGQPINLVSRSCWDPVENPDLTGRMNFFQLWNRTSQAIYLEWPLQCNADSNTSTTFPPDPPYVFEMGSGGADVEIDLPPARYWTDALCYWYTPNCTRDDPHWQYRTFKTAGQKQGNGTVRVPVGESVAELQVSVPASVTSWSGGPGQEDDADEHAGEKLELFDPQGRINSWWNKSAFNQGGPVWYWGNIPMPGVWVFRMTLDTPAIVERTWNVTWVWRDYTSEVGVLGFEWPAEYFEPSQPVAQTDSDSKLGQGGAKPT